MNLARVMLQAMTYDGNRFVSAWLSARACYVYTRSHDGAVINDEGDTISFSRWYALRYAAAMFWERLWR